VKKKEEEVAGKKEENTVKKKEEEVADNCITGHVFLSFCDATDDLKKNS
jgi:hypothetical protein